MNQEILRSNTDALLDSDFVTVSRGHFLERLGRASEDFAGMIVGGSNEQIRKEKIVRKPSHRVPKPATPSQTLSERLGRVFASAHRPKRKRRPKFSHETRSAEAAPGDVMHAIEFFPGVQLSCPAGGGVLPQDIVGVISQRQLIERSHR